MTLRAPEATRARLDSLTSLRFFAAGAVLLLHLWSHTRGRVHEALAPVSRAGFIGVLFFFVLSGYLLRWRARPGAWDFYRRRFARVYPAYLVALAVGAVVIVGVRHGQILSGPAIASVLMVQTWAPHTITFNQLDQPGWSLSAEAFFYAVFPLLVLGIGRLSWGGRAALAAVSAGAVIAAGWLGSYRWDGEPTEWGAYLSRLPVLLIGCFVLGILAAEALQAGTLPRFPLVWTVVVTLALYVVASMLPFSGWTNTLLIAPVTVLVVAAAQHDLLGGGWLSPPVLSELGAASYCLYLFHWPVLDTLLKWHLPPSAVVLVGTSVALIIALVVHRLVEQPMERRLRPDHRLSVADR